MGGAATSLDMVGAAASLTAMVSTSIGYVLTKRWQPPVGPLTWSAWQLVFGGLMIVPVALLVEGMPRALPASAWWGFGYMVLPAPALAYTVWYRGLATLPAGTVGLIGLLNPLTGALCGMVLGGEVFALPQLVGAAMILGGVVAGINLRRR